MEPNHNSESLDADELAWEVVNAWGVNIEAGNAELLAPEFMALFEKACAYRNAKKVADNRRGFNMLTDAEAREERTTRHEFLRAYRSAHEGRR